MSDALFDPAKLKLIIRKKALQMGFIKVGVTSADALLEIEELLSKRVREGKITPFEAKDIRQRIDPKGVFPPCRSVVVFAYPLPFSTNPELEEGILARSAVGEDYHRIVRRKLEQLIVELTQIYPFEHVPQLQVDTGPLNERGFAQKAGVGWIGKNQQLIVPDYGSFVVLGLLLIDVELQPDQPLANRCGECSQCARACPAGIIGDQEFDPRYCLSYLTQQKESLTHEQALLLGRRIFGCDACQEACPHNRQRLIAEAKQGHDLHRGIDLVETLNLTTGAFNEKFRHTAAGWRGKGILQRNSFWALKHLGRESDIARWLEQRQAAKAVPEWIKPHL